MEKCTWEATPYGEWYYVRCIDDEFLFRDAYLTRLRFCPFCGKPVIITNLPEMVEAWDLHGEDREFFLKIYEDQLKRVEQTQ